MGDEADDIVLPEGHRGFYMTKDPSGQLMFGWPRKGVIYWEKAGLTDLLNMGVEQNDIELIVPGEVYRAVVTKVRVVRWG